MSHYDVVVLGCGPAGERAAIQAARAQKRVAVIERAHAVGGNRVNWGTLPSKTLRESAVFFYQLTRHRLHGIRYDVGPELTVADFMFRERTVVQQELESINESLRRYGVEVIKGHGRFAGPGAIAVTPPGGAETRSVTAGVFVIATGSRPNRPDDVPFDGETVFDSETILHLPRMPRTMTVLGAGVVGVEYASIFAALGIAVTLVDTRDRLLPYLDREIVGALTTELQRLGITFISSDRYARIDRIGGTPPRVRCSTQSGRELEADVLLYCVGRDGNTNDLGLGTLGIVPGKYGLLTVNEHYQTTHPHIYAVGDVIGYPALASTSMEQGRQAMRHALGIPGPKGRSKVLPFAIYSIPEVAYIGETEEAMIANGTDHVIGRAQYEKNPRGQILGESGGMLKLIFERPALKLAGTHLVGSGASELVHIGEAFLRSGASAHDIAEMPYNYPTLSDMYRHAALKALAEEQRRSLAERARDAAAPATS
ncbi:MAG: Si-specific NAD(P)(+) transhydrogenase [Acidobacteria bacterium]|nr:Si-specific NAD(P)(+) transhydrogenase [Acidobacteriota bacterium]